MEPLEILLIIIITIMIVYLIYYFYQDSRERPNLKRPLESRVDEYLDRKFEQMIEDWSLVRRPTLQQFTAYHNEVLDQDEEKITELKQYEVNVNVTLQELETRLDFLEKNLQPTSDKILK